MKKRANFKLEFKKERITKLNNLHLIKGGTNTGDHTIEETHVLATCEPTFSVNC